jgi:hypothetical protein
MTDLANPIEIVDLRFMETLHNMGFQDSSLMNCAVTGPQLGTGGIGTTGVLGSFNLTRITLEEPIGTKDFEFSCKFMWDSYLGGAWGRLLMLGEGGVGSLWFARNANDYDPFWRLDTAGHELGTFPDTAVPPATWASIKLTRVGNEWTLWQQLGTASPIVHTMTWGVENADFNLNSQKMFLGGDQSGGGILNCYLMQVKLKVSSRNILTGSINLTSPLEKWTIEVFSHTYNKVVGRQNVVSKGAYTVLCVREAVGKYSLTLRPFYDYFYSYAKVSRVGDILLGDGKLFICTTAGMNARYVTEPTWPTSGEINTGGIYDPCIWTFLCDLPDTQTISNVAANSSGNDFNDPSTGGLIPMLGVTEDGEIVYWETANPSAEPIVTTPPLIGYLVFKALR